MAHVVSEHGSRQAGDSERLGRAQRSLRTEPGRSITAVAREAGFGSSQHFATSYRQAFGHSPSDERDTDRDRRARAAVDPVERRG